MAEINEISCEVTESGHQRVEGREGDQKPLGEGLSKEKARRGGRAGIWLRRQHATRRGGGGGWADNVMALCALWRNER